MDKSISLKEWENGKKLYTIMKMRDLSDFNDVYNVKDIIILGVSQSLSLLFLKTSNR